MAKTKTVRFAVGTPSEPFSGLWRLVVSRDDVYIGASGLMMGVVKISLHKSGVWVLAATKQSGAAFDNGNRRAKQWNRPSEHVKGVTRGPSILVPRTTLGSRLLMEKEKSKKATWIAAPGEGELTEFSIYLVKENTKTAWNSNETVIADIGMMGGERVVLLASAQQSSPDFLATCEKILQENAFYCSNPSDVVEGSFLWVSQSQDKFSVPILVDLPVPIKKNENTIQV